MAGVVRKLPSGRWQASVQYRDPTGKRVTLSGGTADSKKQAERLLPDLLTKAHGQVRPVVPGSLDLLLDRWWDVHAPTLAPSTRRIQGYIIDKHIRGGLGSIPLKALTTYQIELFYSQLTHLGDHARSNIHRILHAALEAGVDWGWLPLNPAAKVKPPRIRRTDRQIPTPAELARFLEAADSEALWFGVFCRVAVASGLRRGELCALRWEDIDWEKKRVLVDEAVSIGVDGVEVTTPKTSRSRRWVSQGPETMKLMATFYVRSLCPPASHFVFGAEHPRNPERVTHIFARVRQRVWGEKSRLRLHDLRHTHGSWLVNGSGVDIANVSARLGHSRISTTLDIYTHQVSSQDSRAAEYVESLLYSPAPSCTE